MIRLCTAVVAAVALTSACGTGSGDPANQKPVDGKTFSFGIGSDPGNLDPHMTVLSVTNQVVRFLYDTLIDLDTGGKPIPSLAEKWDATTTTASFTLRPGITCSDGSPLTAATVAANIAFVGDPANKSPLLGVMIAPGTKATADEASRTVVVTSGAKDAFLLRNVGSLAIVCDKGLKDRKLLAKGESGSGMFAMSEIVPNDHYTLTRRKEYTWGPGQWKAEPGLPDKVNLRVISNHTTSANLLLSGELNAAAIPGPDRQRLEARKLFHSDYTTALGEIFYNQAEGKPGSDEAVRRALTQALDLPQLAKVLAAGSGKPAQGLVSAEPVVCAGDTVKGNLPAFDQTAAKSTLDAAGWKAGPDGIRVKGGKKLAMTVIYGTQLGPTMASTAELIQQAWKAIGADVTLKGVDSPGISTLLFGTGEWEVSLGPIGLTLPSQAVPFMSGPSAPDGTNFAHVKNAEYERMVTEAAAVPGEAGCPTWLAAETALIKKVDVVPYADSVVPYFGSGAKFVVSFASITPSSIRMYAS
ncbi:ABC transporter substrate-binding protein [Amycolatopsis sp. NPDC059657]|uniref:ABC transporter substrate-binding protein n=1 Tax=Amycolatopsis sp. NPDC059657 TaxID=3346899 RepID=UPI00366A9E6A